MSDKNLKIRLIAGWEIDFKNSVELKKILSVQGINKKGFEYFKSVQTATELKIYDDLIIESKKYSDNIIETEYLSVKLPILDWVDREVFFLHKDLNGKHKIGGDIPVDFTLPKHELLKTPFIYIASIDTSDNMFNWIDIPTLEIVYPMFECNFGVFLDYTNPKKPEIMNPVSFDDSWYDNSIKGVEKVIFKEQRFSTKTNFDFINLEEEEGNNLLCGVPLWYQAPDIPICPKSGEVMRFVCTIDTDRSIGLKNEEGIENLPFANYLNFGDHGHLYVFFHPLSKVMYLNIQF